MSLDSLLESSGTLYRVTTGRDLDMGTTEEPFVVRGRTKYSCAADNVACSVQESSSSLTELYKQKNIQVDTVIYFEDDIEPQATDRFEVTDSRGKLHVYSVEGFHLPLFERNQVPYQMHCRKIE